MRSLTCFLLTVAACTPKPGDTTAVETGVTGDATSDPTTGEAPDPTTTAPTSAGTSSSTGDATTTPSPATTDAPETSSSTDTTAAETTTAATTSETDTTGAVDIPCEELDYLACDTTIGCHTVLAHMFDTGSCPDGLTFLACKSGDFCHGPNITVCRDGTDEVYRAPEDCLQPGFTPCEQGRLKPCPACEGLDEAACTAAVDCLPYFGAPHVVHNGKICADFAHEQFLECLGPGGVPCSAAPDVVCPNGQPDKKFTILEQCGLEGFMGGCGLEVEECR